jgi:hypothetical protein
MINQHWARHKDGESKFTCGTKLQQPSTTGLSSAGVAQSTSGELQACPASG